MEMCFYRFPEVGAGLLRGRTRVTCHGEQVDEPRTCDRFDGSSATLCILDAVPSWISSVCFIIMLSYAWSISGITFQLPFDSVVALDRYL